MFDDMVFFGHGKCFWTCKSWPKLVPKNNQVRIFGVRNQLTCRVPGLQKLLDHFGGTPTIWLFGQSTPSKVSQGGGCPYLCEAKAGARLSASRQVVATALRLCEGAYGVAFIFEEQTAESTGSVENVRRRVTRASVFRFIFFCLILKG